jgi:hypothetical protein
VLLAMNASPDASGPFLDGTRNATQAYQSGNSPAYVLACTFTHF